MWPMSRRRHHQDSDYPKELASWQIAHDTDRRDLTLPQAQRLLHHIELIRTGLDVGRLLYARRLVEMGEVSDE